MRQFEDEGGTGGERKKEKQQEVKKIWILTSISGCKI